MRYSTNEPENGTGTKILPGQVTQLTTSAVSADARISALESQLAAAADKIAAATENRCTPDTCQWVARVHALESQLKAAREENERRYTHEEVALWLFEYHGRYREKTLTEFIRERRAVLAAAVEAERGGR
jgi:hypothetical protein